uniref:Putative extracellular protein TR9_061 n=1 Tax=Trebouxia lynnae TaxID=1825957 RepID=A0A7L9QEL5_9CHLO|nr:putative extracellular protein TR9_061 [Trebouxia lynnae]
MKVSVATVALVLSSIALLTPSAQATTNYTDADILQFALNLECLEAEFYSWVAYGEGIASVDSSLVGSNSQLTTSNSGGHAPPSSFTSTPAGILALEIATEIAENEISHVRYLRKALTAAGATPVPCPQLSLSPATFLNAATAAVSAAGATINPSATFDPYSFPDAFYLGAFIFEDVGVTAYKGAVRSLQSQEYAAVAAGIMAIEAGHAAVIRNQLYGQIDAGSGLTDNSGADITIGTAVSGITKLRDNLAGTAAENALTRNTVAVGSTPSTTGPDLFAADSDAIAFTRTPSQVLDIVQFSPSTQALAVGGFFPNGPTGNADVLEISGDSTRTCNSGVLSMASMSAVSVAVMAAVALAM